MHIKATLVALGLMLAGAAAEAGTMSDLVWLMKGKTPIRETRCGLTEKGLFSVESSTGVNCVIYVDYGEKGDIYYILIKNTQSRPTKVIKLDKDKTDDNQTIIWSSWLET